MEKRLFYMEEKGGEIVSINYNMETPSLVNSCVYAYRQIINNSAVEYIRLNFEDYKIIIHPIFYNDKYNYCVKYMQKEQTLFAKKH